LKARRWILVLVLGASCPAPLHAQRQPAEQQRDDAATREAAAPAEPETQAEAAQDQRWILFTQKQELSELVDSCAAVLGMSIEYDPEKLKGGVTMRMAEPLSADALWTLANRALYSRGLASVQTPGSGSLTIVPVTDAPKLARVEPDLAQARAGFVRVLVPLRRDRGLAEAVQLVLSKAGTVTLLAESNAISVADLRPNVEQAMRTIRLLDTEPTLEIEEFRPKNAAPTSLAALIDRVRNARKAVTKEELRGTLISLPEEESVLVIAPKAELGLLRDLLQRFDRVEPVTTMHYHPHRFGLAETANLIQRVVPGTARPMEASAMKVVTDELTGTLIITATAAEHRRIQDLFERLEETKTGPGRPIRSFPVKNRGVEELRDLLEGLLAKGALATTAPAETEPEQPAKPAQGPTAPLSAEAPPPPAAAEPGSEVIIAVDKGTNRLIAMGEPRLLDQLGRLIEELDVKHTQVLIEAISVALTDDQMRGLGVEMQKIGASGDVAVRLASLFGLGSPDPAGNMVQPASGTGFAGVVLDPGNFSAIVRALETVNQGRVLTAPKVLVNNNQQAELNSVTQSPYASTNASQTVATTSFGGTLDAGTQITVTPQIAEGDLLVLDYTVSLSRFVGESSDPALPPPRQENKLHSVATIPDGYTVVVGGLEVDTEGEASSRVPVLGSIPVLGALFASTSKSRTRSRFFVFIRANVLRSGGFEELRYLSQADLDASRVDDGWPVLEPRIIR
jgi:general secretion pathway protein D